MIVPAFLIAKNFKLFHNKEFCLPARPKENITACPTWWAKWNISWKNERLKFKSMGWKCQKNFQTRDVLACRIISNMEKVKAPFLGLLKLDWINHQKMAVREQVHLLGEGQDNHFKRTTRPSLEKFIACSSSLWECKIPPCKAPNKGDEIV